MNYESYDNIIHDKYDNYESYFDHMILELNLGEH